MVCWGDNGSGGGEWFRRQRIIFCGGGENCWEGKMVRETEYGFYSEGRKEDVVRRKGVGELRIF
jgi:hypothetical protein